ncbi:MAG: dihydrodipicolinate synthase family protein, partial [Eubacteriales bacterium]|nr:dihydrodipicolinate synthase family protein [Eubacteriales bacterium]
MKDLRGVYSPVVTFFDEQGNPDPEAAKKHADFLIDAGVDGIVLFGTSGEFFALSMQEKKEYLEAVLRHVDGRVNVLAGVGDTSIVNTMDLLAFAEQAGADGALIVNPYYCVFEEPMVEAYYSRLAESTKL